MKFDVEKTIQYWLEGAEYDIDVAKAMYKTKKYPYALFMAHLSLEKLLKAIVVKITREHAPYTHSLPLLAEKLDIEIPPKIMKKLAKFMEFHFEARYPEEQKKFYKKCSKEFANKSMQEIKEVYTWLKKRL
ncbi:MAG: HEPN domain-containing protein [Nitrospirota bacterium]|jgi:HEPN domain-containing protein